MSRETARLAQLEATVDDLQRELERLRKERRLPMRQTHRCSACGGTRLFHIKTVSDMHHAATVPLSLQKEISAWWGLRKSLGVLEAFVCRFCMLVEWHASSLDGITADGSTVLEVEGTPDADTPESGPYR
ncbi:MAG: hypothetical protein JNL83_33800 [Myxococcales bacterium]|nr:hypothetical protein [Myxococcales bacterium]